MNHTVVVEKKNRIELSSIHRLTTKIDNLFSPYLVYDQYSVDRRRRRRREQEEEKNRQQASTDSD
jgi:hypothetical protein